jgi:hypothetical protein
MPFTESTREITGRFLTEYLSIRLFEYFVDDS